MALPARRRVPRKLHGYFIGFVALFVAIVLAGFSRRFFLAVAFGTFEHPLRVHVHAAFFFGWVMLLVAQVLMAATHQLRLHRSVGRWGVWLVIPMLVTGVWVAARDTQHDFVTDGDAALSFFYGELADLTMFGILAGSAVWLRARPEWHKRLIILSCLGLMGAAFGRIPELDGEFVPVLLAMILSLFGYDLAARRDIHPATVIGTLVLILLTFTQSVIGETAAWIDLAHRFLAV